MHRTFFPFLTAGVKTHSSLTHSITIWSNFALPDGVRTRALVTAPSESMISSSVTRSCGASSRTRLETLAIVLTTAAGGWSTSFCW